MPYNQPRRQPWETEEEEAYRQQMLAEEAAQMQAMTRQPPGPPPSGPYTPAQEALPQATPGALDPRAIQSPGNNPILMARLAGVDDAMEAHAGAMDEFAEGEEPKGFMKNFAAKGLPALLAAAATGGFAIPMALAFGLGAAQEDQRLQTRAQREAKLKASEGKVDLAQAGFENAQDVHSPSGRNEPAELQVWRELTKGLNQDDYNRALRQRLHLDPRPGTTSWGTVIATGADGRKRILQHSRTTGQFATPDGRPIGNPAQWKVIYDFDKQSMDPDALDDPNFDWGGDPPPVLQNDPVPQGEELAQSIAGGPQGAPQGAPHGGPGTQAPPSQGTPVPGQGMPQNRPPASNTQVGGVDFFTSRTPEEEKYAIEQAARQAEADLPLPPTGYKRNPDGTFSLIEGSPQERDASRHAAGKKVLTERFWKPVLDDITKAFEFAHLFGHPLGFLGSTQGEGEVSMGRKALRDHSPTWPLEQVLMSLRSSMSINNLQAIRDASPTGGALGQLPMRQQELLSEQTGLLYPGMEEQHAREVLTRISNTAVPVLAQVFFGDDQELREALQDGRMTEDEVAQVKADREQWVTDTMRQSQFDQRGRRVSESGGQQTDITPPAIPAPPGWEDDWLFLTDEERARITGGTQ